MNPTALDPTPHAQGQIDTAVRGHVLLIGINRPAKRNGFTAKMFRELAEAYTRLDDDPALRVGVLHAAGDHFTAGLDLPSVAPMMQRGERAVPDGLVDPNDLGMPRYRRRTKPMVVAVKGITFTVGIELMLAADIVVAANDCRFSQLEVKRGIMATGGATLRMAERSGLGDLPPTSRTRLKLVKSVNHQENDGHEEEQIHRGTDHRLPQAGRGRHADQGAVPQWRFQ